MSHPYLFVWVFPGVFTMADFPPNLEDGEQWLPSDIYQEIITGSLKLEAFVDNSFQECDAEIESFEHGGTRVLKEQNRLFPVHGNGEELKGFVGNSGGTGVFLPQITLKESKASKQIKGTGVFLQSVDAHAPTTTHKKKKSGKIVHRIEKKLTSKKLQTPKQKELSQLSSEICLPQEWTY